MPFDKKYDDVFEFAIKDAVQEKESECIRMDKVLVSVNLITTMMDHIYNADIIVADLSGLRANVFYELGIAHSINTSNKTIMIANEDEEIPFDIRLYNVIKYNHIHMFS